MTTMKLKPEASTRSIGLLIISITLLIMLFQGISIIDTDAPQIWRAMLGIPFEGDSKRLYLAEGLLPNSIGIMLLYLKMSDRTTLVLWWSIGVLALVSSFSYSIRRGTITIFDVLLIITFTRLVDTLSMWIGKFDPYLLSLLVLSANHNRSVSRVSIALAALCHPLAAVLSSAGNFAVEFSLKAKPDILPMLISVAFAFLDIQLAHRLVPSMVDRSGFILSTVGVVLMSGAECGLVTFVSVFVVPFGCICEFKPNISVLTLGRVFPLVAWLACATVIGCLIALDHTRVAFLITLAPLITFLRITQPRLPAHRIELPRIFYLLAAARLVIPHVAGDSFLLFNWTAFGRVLRSVL